MEGIDKIMDSTKNVLSKSKKPVGCLLKGVGTIIVLILITFFSTETNSPAILHWTVGIGLLYLIWTLPWGGESMRDPENQKNLVQEVVTYEEIDIEQLDAGEMVRAYRTNPDFLNHKKSLTRIKLLLDHPWTLKDESGKTTRFIFKKRGRLLVSSDGEVHEGSWEHLAEAKSLYLKYGDRKLLYNEVHFQDELLILRKDASSSDFDVLVNQNAIPDLDWKKYWAQLYGTQITVKKEFSEVEVEQKLKNQANYVCQLAPKIHLLSEGVVELKGTRLIAVKQRSVSLADGRKLELYYSRQDNLLGSYPTIDGKLVSDGLYVAKDLWLSIIYINNSRVNAFYTELARYKIKRNVIVIHCINVYLKHFTGSLRLATLNNEKLPTGIYRLSKLKNIIIQDGAVIKIYFRFKWLRILFGQSVTDQELIISPLPQKEL